MSRLRNAIQTKIVFLINIQPNTGLFYTMSCQTLNKTISDEILLGKHSSGDEVLKNK